MPLGEHSVACARSTVLLGFLFGPLLGPGLFLDPLLDLLLGPLDAHLDIPNYEP